MIAVEEKIIGTDTTRISGTSLTATSERNEGERPANVVLTFGSNEIREAHFAGLRFDRASKTLMPSVEIGQWNDIILVMGLRKWMIFCANPMEQAGSVDLYRLESDDSGFYRERFIEREDLLIAVYEGGVVAISNTGKVVWHRKKYWDNELLRADDRRLIFLSEDGRPFALDGSTGKNVDSD